MHNKIYKTILWVTVFAIAMAYMETAVVVYMRALYYPEGFDFPLKQIDKYIALTEFFREVATMFMLIGIGVIAGRKNIERFAFFIYSFAVWDIFYYVFLKLLLGWPASFLTWDILFMIPVAWVGPVICPVINSFTMILLALLIIFFVEVKGNAEIGAISWILLITGSLIIILSYTLDYTQFMLGKMSLLDLLSFKNSEEVIKYTSEYKPAYFNWYIFNAGEIMHLAAIMLFYYKNRFKL